MVSERPGDQTAPAQTEPATTQVTAPLPRRRGLPRWADILLRLGWLPLAVALGWMFGLPFYVDIVIAILVVVAALRASGLKLIALLLSSMVAFGLIEVTARWIARIRQVSPYFRPHELLLQPTPGRPHLDPPAPRYTPNTDINFDGGGIRVGLDAEWYGANRQCFVYGRSAASFVAGKFEASYRQNDLFGQDVIYTDWQVGRIVTMLDLEVGIGLTNRDGWARASVGYMVSGWFNTVNTDEFIKAAAVTGDFTGLNSSMTFDGAVVRAEIRF